MPLTLKLFKSVFPPFASCWWAARFCGSSSKSIHYSRFAVVLTIAAIFLASGKSLGQTWLPTAGGNWATGSNWSGGSAPVAGANVIINSDQSAPITNIPTISLSSLTVNSTCSLVAAAAGNTVTVTNAFSVTLGKTLTYGTAAGRLNFTLDAAATGTISGTMAMSSGGTARTFLTNGDLTITGLLSGTNTDFTLTTGATLRIGSLAGITTTGATGSVQVTGVRSYSTAANYHYIGSGAQGVGNGLPATVSSLTINNTGGTVTLAASIAITNGLAIPSGTLAIGANNISTVSSVSMTGTSITGTGTLTLAGNVTTLVSATSATISAPIATGASSRTFTIADGAANPDLIISSVISGTGGVIKAGAGTLTLSGANTFGTGLNHTAGTININNATAPGTGTFTIAGGTIDNTSGGAIILSNNNTQAWNGNFVFTGTQSLNLGTGAVTPNASRQVTVDGNTLTVGGVIGGGAVSITKLGNGIMALSGANTFTGGMTLSAGTLNINNANALGASGTFTINGGTIDNTTGGAITTLNYPQAWNGNFIFTGTQNLNLGTGAVTPNASRQVTVAANTLTIGGVIGGGAVGITKLGAGTMTLSGASTFTGGMTLSAGTLNINNTNALGGASGTFTINGGIIDNTTGGAITTVNYPQAWNSDFTFLGTQNLNLGTGTVTMSANRQVTVAANTFAVGGIIAGAGFSLTKSGAGALTLSGANTFSGGVNLNTGTLNINNASALGSVAGAFTINGGTINNTTGGAITTLNYPQVWNSDFVFTGTQNLNLGTGAVTMTGNRQVTVNANTLTAGGVLSAAAFNLTKAGAGTLNFGGSAVTINSLTISAGTLTSTSGTLALAGNFTNSGTFIHNTGTVHYNGGLLQSVASVNYYNLTLSGAGQKNALAAINVANALTNTSIFDVGSNTLSVTGPIVNTGGTIRFSGSTNGLAVNTGTIEYYGSSQTVTSGIYSNLLINQSSGEASLSGGVTVNGVLTLSNGRLNTMASLLTLGSTASISVVGPSASKMIVASGGGEVRRIFASTGSFVFPIGENTGAIEYSPVTVNVTSAGGFPSHITVSVTDAKHPNNSSATNFISRYWNVNTGLSPATATITGTYLPVDINGTEASASAAQLNGAFGPSNPWTKFTALGSNTLTTTGATLTAGQTSAFTGISTSAPTVTITNGASETICAGSSVALVTSATGDPVLTYAWSPALGLSSTTISNPVASPTTTTVYTVVMTDGNGITATDNITVNVLPLPTLTGASQPTPACESTGAVINLTGLLPSSTSTVNYSINGVAQAPVPGVVANGAGAGSFTTAALTISNNGQLLQVTGLTVTSALPNCSQVFSRNVTLTVQQTAVITTPPSAATGCEGSAVQYNVTAAGSNLAYQWQEDSGSGFTNITNGGVYSGATSATLTLTGITSAMNTYDYRVVVSNSSGPCTGNVTSAGFNLTVNEQPEVTLQPVNSLICETTNTTFTVSAGVTTVPGYQWQESTNGGVSYSNIINGGIYSGATTATLTLTGVPLGHSGSLYRAVITGTCSPSATSNGALLTVHQTAVITTPPSAATGCEGSTVQYNVTAAGSNLAYQWQEDSGSGFTNITNGGIYGGATTSTLTLTGITSAMNTYDYRVVVSNSSGPCTGNVTSAGFNLTVNEQPEVTLQPVNSLICETANTTFTVSAGVTTVPVYQWQESTNGGVSYSNIINGGIYSGATTATLTLTGVPLGHSGRLYRAVITGTCSPSATSNGALLTVQQTAVITTPPSAATGCEGSTVQYNVTAAGSNLAYQWQEDSGSGFTNITNGGIYGGATTSILTLTGITSAMNTYDYRVVVSNSSGPCTGNVTSAGFNLTVNEQPEVTLQPVNSLICETANTTFTVSAGVTTVPVYQWQESTNGGVSYSNLANAGIYSGVTTATLTLTGVPLGHSGRLYRAVITGTCSPSATSNGALLTVHQTAVITTPPSAATGCEGSTVQYNVTATGSNLAYQWQEDSGSGFTNITNGGVYSGATSATLTLTGITSSMNTYDYRVVVSNSSGPCTGNVTSAGFNLTVNRNPDAFAANQTICSGATTSISITNPNSVPSTTFSWIVQNSTNVSGASAGAGTAITQALTSVDGINNGTVTYLIQASALGCNGPAFAVTVTVLPPPAFALTNALTSICSASNTNITLNTGVTGGQIRLKSVTYGAASGTLSAGALFNNGAVVNELLTNTTNAPVVVTYEFEAIVGTCVSAASQTTTVTVNPNPTFIVTNGSAAICSGASTSLLFNSTTAGHLIHVVNVSYNGAGNSGTIIPGTTTFTNGNTLIEALTNATNTPINVVYEFNITTPSTTPVCPVSTASTFVTVRVNPTPDANGPNQSICSGTTSNVLLTNPNNVAGTTFSWAIGTVIGSVSGQAAGSGNAINQLLNSTAGGSVEYLITPSANGCPGTTISRIVTVNPIPVGTSVPAGTHVVCSGTLLGITPVSSVSGSTFVWNGSNGSGGTGDITDTPVNTGSAAIDITYTVTPTGPSTTFCTGTSFTIVVTVNPAPVVSNATPITICSGDALNFVPAINVAGSTYTWTSSIAGPVTPASVTASGTTPITDSPINVGSQAGTVTYTIIPTGPGSCVGASYNYTVTVRAEPVGANASASVCSDVPINYNLLLNVATLGNNVGSSFVWIATDNANPGVTGESLTNQSGLIITDVITNTTNTDQVVTYTATPTGTNGCGGDPFIITITVKPEPVGVTTTAAAICSGTTFGYNLQTNINSLGNNLASTFTWIAASHPDITGESTTIKSGAIIDDVLINTSTADQTVVYTVTPTGQVGGCVGNAFMISVLVNPRPVFSAGPDLAVCVSDLSKVLSGSVAFAPSGVSWSGGTGSFDVPSSATPTYTLSPAQLGVTSPLNVTLTLTANGSGACPVQTDQMILTVNPLPTVVFFGLPPSPPGVAENGAVIPISGNQAGGLFTITPGIGLSGTTTGPLDKATLDPDAATVYDGTPGTINHITYTYTDGNGCTNSSTQNLIVNAVTDVDFAIQGATIDSFGQFELCSELGPVKLLGFPAPNTGLPPETEFISLTPGLTITRTGSDYFIQTTGLPSGTYEIKYVYKNAALVVSDRIRSVKIFASPRAQFTSSNNCIINDVVFADLSTIDPTPFPTNIASWQWAFGDNDFSTNQNPSKRYLTSGTYNVTLRVTTLQGCSNATPVGANQVRVGDVPVVDFNWSAICNNDLTKFSDNTDPGSVSTIQTYTWDFGDGTPVISGAAGAPVTGSPTTTGTYTNPDHEYPTFGNYNTVLTVQTNDGCSNGLVKRVFILPYNTVTPAASLAYEENFELTDGGWITEAFNATNSTPSNIIKSDTSWVWGTPFGVTINNTNSTKAWWTGDNTATFYSNENSVVNGPCFNLTQLSRPMVSLDYFSDVESVDGAVLQYSVNGGISWRIVGPPEGQPSRDEGINWFNGTGIFSNPGTQSIGNYGWTSKQGSWKNARFNLDMIPVANRAQVRLRIAFSSNDGNASVESFDGFAFDNFFVGEKKRNVLVEHFTTTSLNASISADTYLNGLYQQQITDRGASDFNNIQYHLNFAGTDQFNQGNPTDPAARALYFGASQPPYTIMDGILIPGKFTGVAGELNKVEIDRRALVDPQFTLTLDTIPTGNNKTISLRLGMTATKGINIPLIAQVALIEEDVTITSPSGTFRNVLRKLLMGSDGETINTSFVAGQTLNRERLNVELNIPIAASTKLTLVGFIQDKNSKEIYQSIVVKAPRKIGEIIVGVEDDEPVIAALNSIQMFPNPANNEFTFGLPGTIAPQSQWKIADQRGVIVLEGDFANAFNDQKQVDVSSLANGVYFVTITAPGGHVVRRKLVVMNRN